MDIKYDSILVDVREVDEIPSEGVTFSGGTHDFSTTVKYDRFTMGTQTIESPTPVGDLLQVNIGIGNTVSGLLAYAHGKKNTATGRYAHAEGYQTFALGEVAHTEGTSTDAEGGGAHAEGHASHAQADYSHAEGEYSTASGYAAHAEGLLTTAGGTYSHAEGWNNSTAAMHSHVEGFENVINAAAEGAHVEGHHNITSADYQHVEGRWNADVGRTYQHVVGGGSDENHRANIYTLDWYGNAVFAGTVTVAGLNISGGTVGQVLTKTASGSEWADAQGGGGGGLGELPCTEMLIPDDTYLDIEAGQNYYLTAPDGGTTAILDVYMNSSIPYGKMATGFIHVNNTSPSGQVTLYGEEYDSIEYTVEAGHYALFQYFSWKSGAVLLVRLLDHAR